MRARARHAEVNAQVDEIGRYLAEQRERERQQWFEARDRRAAMMEELRELADSKLAHVPLTRDQQRELLAELDAAIAAADHPDGLFYHNGRLWDRSRFYPSGT